MGPRGEQRAARVAARVTDGAARARHGCEDEEEEEEHTGKLKNAEWGCESCKQLADSDSESAFRIPYNLNFLHPITLASPAVGTE